MTAGNGSYVAVCTRSYCEVATHGYGSCCGLPRRNNQARPPLDGVPWDRLSRAEKALVTEWHRAHGNDREVARRD